MMIQGDVKPGHEAAAAKALGPFLSGPAKLYESAKLPSLPTVDLALAEKIADAIEPRPNQPMRREVLRSLFLGHDTWWDQKGEPDPAFRNGTAALSRALRPFFPYASPLDGLFTRERTTFKDHPAKGLYKGTRYRPTILGAAVGQILKDREAI